MKLTNLIIIAAICCSAQLHAQNTTAKKDTTLNRELTLEREYNPSIRDASKINTLPELKEPEAPKTQVEYAGFSSPFDIKPQLNPLQAGSYFTNVPYSKKRGYLSLGVSTFVDVDVDAGYQILNTDIDQFNIFGSHRSTNGNVKYLQSDEKQKMKINDNLLGLTYDHLFGKTKFTSGVSYTYSGFNYYGKRLDDNSIYSVAPLYPEVQKDKNQVDQIFDLNLGLSSKVEDAFNYLFKVNYSNFNQKYLVDIDQKGAKENNIQLDLDLNKNWDSEKLLGIRAFYKGNFYSLSNEGRYNFGTFPSYSDVGLNPYFFYDGGNWNARVGLLVDLLFNHDKDINLAPDVELNFRPVDKVLIYLNAKGGVTNNSLKNIYYENRYLLPYIRPQDSYSSLDATLGVRSSIENFWFDLFAGYKSFSKEHFYYQYFSSYDGINGADGTIPMIGENFSIPTSYDGHVFKLGADLKYQFTDAFELGLKAVYYGWTLDKLAPDAGNYSPKALNTPSFIGDLGLGYKLTTLPLKLDLNYHLETGRNYVYASILTYGFTPDVIGIPVVRTSVGEGKMKDINYLSFKANYTINDTFSAFLKLKNLLFQKYDMWYGYPAEGFSLMAGVNIKF